MEQYHNSNIIAPAVTGDQVQSSVRGEGKTNISVGANNPFNAAQTEMHAVSGGGSGRVIEHPPVFSIFPSLVTSVTERYFIHLGVHYASSGNICGARVKNAYISPWLDIYQYIWDYNLQSEIRAEQQSVD